jgi:hypothetical protein
MIQRLKRIALYAIERGKEPSSWAGVAALLSLAHHGLSNQDAANLAIAGAMLAGFLAVAVKE